MASDESRWRDMWRRLGASDQARVEREWRRLQEHYSRPPRVYHTYLHIRRGLALFDEYRHLVVNPDAFEFAWNVHDVIYMIGKEPPEGNSNEELSADYAKDLLRRCGGPLSDVPVVRRMVLATAHLPDLIRTTDEAFIADIDFSILGMPWDAYVAYVAAVRREYGQYSDKEFLLGRTGWIVRTGRDRLFCLDEMNARFGRQARDNMDRELEAYRGSDFAKLWNLAGDYRPQCLGR